MVFSSKKKKKTATGKNKVKKKASTNNRVESEEPCRHRDKGDTPTAQAPSPANMPRAGAPLRDRPWSDSQSPPHIHTRFSCQESSASIAPIPKWLISHIAGY